jgi:hypothetical protein
MKKTNLPKTLNDKVVYLNNFKRLIDNYLLSQYSSELKLLEILLELDAIHDPLLPDIVLSLSSSKLNASRPINLLHDFLSLLLSLRTELCSNFTNSHERKLESQIQALLAYDFRDYVSINITRLELPIATDKKLQILHTLYKYHHFYEYSHHLKLPIVTPSTTPLNPLYIKPYNLVRTLHLSTLNSIKLSKIIDDTKLSKYKTNKHIIRGKMRDNLLYNYLIYYDDNGLPCINYNRQAFINFLIKYKDNRGISARTVSEHLSKIGVDMGKKLILEIDQARKELLS